MKNICLIRNIGPHLLPDYSCRDASALRFHFWSGLGLCLTLSGVFFFILLGLAHAQAPASDPTVMKVYPDGTKVLLPWSEVGKSCDDGKKFGGAPKIVPYDPARDGVVPIGQPSPKTESDSTNSAVPSSTSVVSPDQPAKMDYTNADPKDYKDAFGAREGFAFRTAVGVAYQQPLSGRNGSGDIYQKLVFQPGIRYDLEAQYNVTDWFRTGVETAFLYNELHSSTLNARTSYSGGPNLGNGGLFQIPILYSATFRFPSDGPWQGYLGGGGGANWNVLQASSGGGQPYTSYHWNWAWQATTGFTYCVSEGLDLDIAYKLLSMPNPNFADLGQFKSSFNHSAQIGLTWRF